MRLFYYFNFERNYEVLKSKSPCILINKNINFNKNEPESKMENTPLTVLERPTLRFSSYKNRKLKAKLSWVGARERKKEGIFCSVYFALRKFVFYSIFSLLNILLEYTYFYIWKNTTSCTFLLLFKIIERLQCFLNSFYDVMNVFLG